MEMMDSDDIIEITDNRRGSKQDIVTQFHPIHQKLIEHTLSQRIGIFNRKYRIKRTSRCGQDFLLKNHLCNFYDVFTIQVPILGEDLLQWQIIFNEFKIYARPDIKFNDDRFTIFLLENTEIEKSYLAKYNSEQENMFSLIIEQFRTIYSDYMLLIMKKACDHLYKDILAVLAMYNKSHGEYELHISNNLLHLAIQLNLDFSHIQLNISKEDCVVLVSVSLPYQNDYDCGYYSHVKINPKLEAEMEMSEIRFPKFSKGISLCHYFQTITTKIQNDINELSILQLKRKEAIFKLLTVSGVSVIEWDSIQFRHISFLYNMNDFYCIVKFILSHEINVCIKSIYNNNNNSTLRNIPLDMNVLEIFTILQTTIDKKLVKQFVQQVFTNIVKDASRRCDN